MNRIKKRGFTLVELLIVIAILGVLGTASVLVLNPAELIKRGRDATRISDLGSINRAIAYYLTESSNPELWPGGCAASHARCTVGTTEFFNGTSTCLTVNSAAVDGTGWVAVNMNSLTDGSPIGSFPLDPINNSTYYYSYGCKNLRYELNANMESTKYAQGGGNDDVESTDGGDQAGLFEAGNYLTCCN